MSTVKKNKVKKKPSRPSESHSVEMEIKGIISINVPASTLGNLFTPVEACRMLEVSVRGRLFNGDFRTITVKTLEVQTTEEGRRRFISGV